METTETPVEEQPKRAPNGVSRAKRVRRGDSGFRKASKNIAAIDFGTTNCSLGYITENDTLELINGVIKCPFDGCKMRVPTAILLTNSGDIDSFGKDARIAYSNLEDCERESYFFFEEIKMDLQGNEGVCRNMKVKAANGKEFFLVDVISQILKYLKDTFIKYLCRAGHSFKATDFDWVITVPAIWKAGGKQMMREAGYKAGLCSKESCGKLRVVSDAQPLQPSETAPNKLSLALEPESAAIYCHEMLSRDKTAKHCSSPEAAFTPHSYLIVDVGGGTVDITAHKLVSTPGEPVVVEELHPPTGNDWGGSRVNQRFSEFLQDLVRDRNFTRYIGTCCPEENLAHKCHLMELINVTFEEQKQSFGRATKHRPAVIHLPSSLYETYKVAFSQGVERLGKDKIKLAQQSLRISPQLMEEFLEPSMKGILSCISDLLQKLSEQQETVDVIYLVGGYGGCPYVYDRVVKEFGHQYKCFVPDRPEFAVVEGAVLSRTAALSSTVRARKADVTYGTDVVRQFDSKIHDKSYRKLDDDGVPQCHNLFKTVVEVGETVNPEYVYTVTSMPNKHDQKNMLFEIYGSPQPANSIWYVKGSKKARDVVKIGKLVVEMPDLTGDKSREVEVTFDFSHTELQVKGYDKTSQNEVKTVVDFLSAQ